MAGRPKKKVAEEVAEVVESATVTEEVKPKKENKADTCKGCKHKPKYGSAICKTCVLFQGVK